MAHFSDCGKHCEDPYCKQCDLLPFKCDACGKFYCSQHFSYEAHSCPKGRRDTDRRVIVCPICTIAIPLKHGQDENEVWERHAASGNCCSRETVAKINRCPVKGCKEKLTFSNACNCGSCGIKVCLKHRFEDLHECIPAQAGCRAQARANETFLARAEQQLRRMTLVK